MLGFYMSQFNLLDPYNDEKPITNIFKDSGKNQTNTISKNDNPVPKSKMHQDLKKQFTTQSMDDDDIMSQMKGNKNRKMKEDIKHNSNDKSKDYLNIVTNENSDNYPDDVSGDSETEELPTNGSNKVNQGLEIDSGVKIGSKLAEKLPLQEKYSYPYTNIDTIGSEMYQESPQSKPKSYWTEIYFPPLMNGPARDKLISNSVNSNNILKTKQIYSNITAELTPKYLKVDQHGSATFFCNIKGHKKKKRIRWLYQALKNADLQNYSSDREYIINNDTINNLPTSQGITKSSSKIYRLDESEKIKITPDGYLIIKDVQPRDSGLIYCQLDNQLNDPTKIINNQVYAAVSTLIVNDINECLVEKSPCEQICVNTIGSYYCQCKSGYILINGTKCVDINECLDGINYCSQLCQNLEGSFRCHCYEGFSLSKDDHKTCNDIDECQTIQNVCEYNCTNLIGSYRCECPEGMLLSQDGRSCKIPAEKKTGNSAVNFGVVSISQTALVALITITIFMLFFLIGITFGFVYLYKKIKVNQIEQED